MDELSAPNTWVAPLKPAPPLFLRAQFSAVFARVETFLETERGQLPLWFVAAFGMGIAAWFALPDRSGWLGVIVLGSGLALLGAMVPGSRVGRSLLGFGVALAAGCGLIWWRADAVAAPRLARPLVTEVAGTIEKVETIAAKGNVRLTLATDGGALPPRIRVSIAQKEAPSGLLPGARVAMRARLAPPPPMALPGTHDFARDAWFRRIGAVGKSLGPVRVTAPGDPGGLAGTRARLDAHIRERLPGPSGTIATALATGDQYSVSEADAEAMRRSGLTHLLSVSGLHIAAAVGAAMLLTLRLLALSERLARRYNLVLVAAGAGALAGVAYTLLTGMQVPTVRSCIAALLVLAGIALGRDALSLRLVAVGALAVLLVRPESLAGPSFQLSFAAVTAIVVLHNSGFARRWLGPRDDSWPRRAARTFGSLLLTGLAVELALVPLALFHFHKAGLYGVAANLVAIPWTTFVIMPLEAMALALDPIGIAGPFWVATGWAIDGLLGLAHWVAGLDGAVAMLPSMSRGAFGLMALGGLWFCLWTRRVRWLGAVPAALGAIWAAATPTPDLLVTGDGRHVALVREGRPVLLRERSGDFVRSLVGEAAGYDGDPLALIDQPYARCSRDSCVATIRSGGRDWNLLAIRSRDRIRWEELTAACAAADIVVAERWLPRGCTPRWLKLDRKVLETTGGVAIRLGDPPAIATVSERLGEHPWAVAPSGVLAVAPRRQFGPARIDEVKAPPTGKSENVLRQGPAGSKDRVARGFEVADPDHR